MTAHLGHFQAPASGFAVNGVPVVEATAAVLCPDCLGDWCDACNWTGMARPSDSTVAAGTPEPLGGAAGEEPAAEAPNELVAAVERWLSITLPRKEAA